MSRSLDDMQPESGAKAALAIEKMRNDAELKTFGVTGVYISETKRELSTQMAYYSRSRMSVSDVKKMYAAAGLYHIGDDEAKRPNTWTLNSRHLSGNAIDLVPEIDGVISWSAPQKIWSRMGKIGKQCGLKWGGDWEEKDLPHFENQEET